VTAAKKSRKSRAKYIFGVLILCLIGYVAFDIHKSKESGGVGEFEQKLTAIPTSEINSLRVSRRGSVIEIKKQNGSFEMLQPVVDKVDSAQLSSFLNSVTAAKVQKIDEKEGAIDWSQYGMTDGTEIQIGTNKATETLTISNTNAYDGSFYIRKGDQLFLGDRAFAHLADKKPDVFRSKVFWRAEGEVIKVFYHLELPNQKPETVVFEKTENTWKVQPEFDLPLVSERVQAWVDDVKELEAHGIVASQLEPGRAADYAMNKPSLSMEFSVRKDGKVTKSQWTFGQDKGEDVFIQTSARPDLYKVSPAGIREIRVPVESFLNGKDTLKFPVEEAVEMTLTVDGKSTVFKKGDKEWAMAGPMAEKFKPAALVGFFQKLTGMDPIVGLTPPDVAFQGEKNRLTIRSRAKILLEISFSAEKDQKRWLKTNLWKETLHTGNENWQSLLKTNFTVVPQAKTEPSKAKNR
jgi:hypothetical protein